MADLDTLAAKSGVHSVDNALRVLLLFRARESLGVAETARALGVGRATAHRLVTTLVAHDFLVQDPETRLYRAGPALCEIATSLEGTTDGRSDARPHLRELAEQLGETVTLVTLRGDHALVLEAIRGSRRPAVPAEAGSVLPAHLSAEGHALLARLPAERLMELYPDGDAASPRRQVTAGELRRGPLAQVLDRGYALRLGGAQDRVASVGAPVGGLLAGEHVAIGVAVPHARVRGADDLAFIAEAALATAAELTRDVAVAERPAGRAPARIVAASDG